MMTCKACVDLLRDFLDGELDAPTHGALETHLNECGVCERFMTTYRNTPKLCREALEEKMPDSVTERLKSFLTSRCKSK
jgi:anti-sigma factor RsiW